jgi:hypothetical protein
MTDKTIDVPLLGVRIPDGGDPTVFGQDCVLSHQHQPEPRYLEAHHLVPRAWQHFFTPSDVHLASDPFHPPNSSGLWCTETVLLCRTGHGNVHYWIERMVKAYGALETGPDHTDRAMHAARQGQLHIGERETLIAREALVLFSDAGGNVEKLFEAGLFGGIYGGQSASD